MQPNQHTAKEEIRIALAGNPNVGKSTVFNALTGMKQHTGNWPGKTVDTAQGVFTHRGVNCRIFDIPGAYSLLAASREEEIARDFICFGEADVTVVVCDATCLERNMNLALQILEATGNVVLCVNLMDEAAKKHIEIDFEKLSGLLGIPVIPTSAGRKKGLWRLKDAILQTARTLRPARIVKYPEELEAAIESLGSRLPENGNTRWCAARLLEGDDSLSRSIAENLHMEESLLRSYVGEALSALPQTGSGDSIRDRMVCAIYGEAAELCHACVCFGDANCNARRYKLDKILTNKWSGTPIMLALLALIFYITISGANYPSEWLSQGLFQVQEWLSGLLLAAGAPVWLHDALVLGIFRVMAWIVSVMLPPMAIFFPLFTLLEDLGYLPRVAFNLDNCFRKCSACGKQALTTCMGFGCNAVGVTGCRIIDSPRERLIAILTNSLVPCNGRFPLLIAISAMFFAAGGALGSALSLSLMIAFSICMTLLASRLLSKTLLRGTPSSFALELPPYRKPQIGKVIVRSIFDRTVFVLGRAVSVAAPAGLVIWLCANVYIGDASLLAHCTGFLDPLGRLMGMDGVLLMAFILGMPANEIVIPIAVMAYMSTGSLQETAGIAELHALFVANGWTWLTGLCTILFSLMHWPCATTLLTISKETKSAKWTLTGFALPTLMGMCACMLVTAAARLFGLA